MICKQCGAQIDDNSAECKFCGALYDTADDAGDTRVVDAEAVKEAAAKPEESMGIEYSGEEIDRMLDENEKNRRRQQEKISSEKKKQLEEIEKRRESKKKKQRRNRVIAGVAVAAVLGAAGYGAYYVNQDKTPDVVVVSHEPTQEATTEAAATPETIETSEPTATPAASWNTTGGSSVSGAGSSGSGTAKSGAAAGSAGAAKAGSAGSAAAKSSSAAASGSSASSGGAAAGGNAAKSSNNTANVSDISPVATNSEGYIFPDTSSVLLTEADLAGKSAKELRIGRNEIYARHGRTFRDKELQAYFNSCSWYKVNPDYITSNDAANLNEIERKNAAFILNYEKTHK